MNEIRPVNIRIRDPHNPDAWLNQPLCGELITEHLAITPITIRRGDGCRFRGDWQVTHVPTGVPRTDRKDVDDVERIARRLARVQVDWSSADLDSWKDPAVGQAIVKAIEALDEDDEDES